jgi:hypothetical protein
MKQVVLLASLCLFFLAAPMQPIQSGGDVLTASPVLGAASAAAQPEIEVQIVERPWYENPVWMAIGILAVIVLILLVVMAVRGGGGPAVRG